MNEQQNSPEKLSPPALKSWKSIMGGLLIAVVVGVSVGAISSHILFKPEPRISPYNNEALVRMAQKINRNLPTKAGKETELYSVSAEDKLLHYHYRLTSLTQVAMDSMNFNALMHAKMLANYCGGSAFKIFRDNGISLQYSYRDSSEQLLSSISITPDGCLSDPLEQSG